MDFEEYRNLLGISAILGVVQKILTSTFQELLAYFGNFATHFRNSRCISEVLDALLGISMNVLNSLWNRNKEN